MREELTRVALEHLLVGLLGLRGCSPGRAVGRRHVAQHVLRVTQYALHAVLAGDRSVLERGSHSSPIRVVPELPFPGERPEVIDHLIDLVDLLFVLPS